MRHAAISFQNAADVDNRELVIEELVVQSVQEAAFGIQAHGAQACAFPWSARRGNILVGRLWTGPSSQDSIQTASLKGCMDGQYG